MNDNELKLQVLEVAVDIARENMFARRMTQENRFERRTLGGEYPELVGLQIAEIVENYHTLMNAFGNLGDGK
jgi:hypothetical protein